MGRQTWQLRCTMLAPVPIARAFEIFENPYNLAQLTPAWLNFKVVTPDKVAMRAGADIDYLIRWMALPVRWRTKITSYDPPFGFVDEQARGPYALWRHRHLLEETPAGTIISDCVTYRLPLGFLGNLAHAVLVRRQLLEIFRFRQRAIRDLLNVPGVSFNEPEISRVSLLS